MRCFSLEHDWTPIKAEEETDDETWSIIREIWWVCKNCPAYSILPLGEHPDGVKKCEEVLT